MKGKLRPEALAIIPARGGSKGIVRKNLRPLAGRPLISHTIEAALAAEAVARVIVTTDDTEIARTAQQYGAEVVARPSDISGDEASSESALLHVLDHLKTTESYDPDLVVFLQCTSPVRQPDDIDRAISTLLDAGADSLVSACSTHRFLWRATGGQMTPVNYDYRERPRRQDRQPEYVENGSIYAFRPWVLRESGSRLGGKVALYEMDYWSSFEIDTTEDMELCEWIMQRRAREAPVSRLPSEVRLVVFDFDGVFTDNRVLVLQDGREAVLCHRGDGYGLTLLRAAGVPLLVLSKETNPVVQARCRKIPVECLQGIDDKKPMLMDLLGKRGIDPSHVIYMGNDVNDLECMRTVGCGVAPADAHPSVLDEADLVLRCCGGHGAIRELSDLILSRTKQRSAAR